DSRSFLERSARVRKLVKLRHLPRVTQRDGNRIVRMAGRHECGDDQLTFDRFQRGAFCCDRDLHQVAGCNTKPLRKARTHERGVVPGEFGYRSEEHTSELQSRSDLVCRLLLEKKNIRVGFSDTRSIRELLLVD